MAREKRVTKLQFFLHWLYRVLSLFYTKLFLGFKRKSVYKIKKGERLIVISNHQTDLDPLCIATCFKGRLYPVATDTIFSGKTKGKFLDKTFGVIPKKKGFVDSRCTMLIYQTIKEGGSVLLFPEGNRTYAEFQFFITPSISKMLKKLQCKILIFNIHGGTGTSPRFANKKRKGKFYGEIKRILPYEEYENMDNDELFNIIKDGIRVYDSESNELYKSNKRAEYLEREFFVCPKCLNANTLYSKGNYIKCNNCNLNVEYTEDLKLVSDDKEFNFTRLIDWWNFDKKYIRDMIIDNDEIIFSDNATLYISNPYQKRKKLYEGMFSITRNYLKFGDLSFNVKDINGASVISGRKIGVLIGEDNYLIVGDERFNPLKYIFLFNKIDTSMKINQTDKYFTLEDD